MNFKNFDTVQAKCPMDMRRYIGKFFDNEKLNTTFNRLNTDSFLEYNLKELPQPTIIKLFINAIYKKFYNFDDKHMRFGIGHSGKNSNQKFNHCEFPSPLQQFIKIQLDTIYYGYHMSGSAMNCDLPQYTFQTYKYNYFKMVYVPRENHDSLTDKIPVNQFAKLIRLFSQLGIQNKLASSSFKKYNLTKENRSKCEKILRDFAVILQFLGKKYRKINREARESAKIKKMVAIVKANYEKLAAKERAKQEKLVAKERATQEKLRAKQEKLDAKERAKQEKLAAKERAKQEKLATKELVKKEKLTAKQRGIIIANKIKNSRKLDII